jgi:DNA-directed RNA polymerase subunit beta'
MAFEGGLSFNLGDVLIPEEKEELINKANDEINSIKNSYLEGWITPTERYNQVIDVWSHTNRKLSDILMKKVAEDRQGLILFI